MRAVAVLTVAYATLAFAQSNNGSRVYTAQDLGPWANDVTDSQRRNWCLGQTNTCRELCDRNTNANTCEGSTLEYECTCSDDSTPDLQNYVATLPTHICQYVYERCTEAAPDNLAGKQACEDAWNASCHPDNLLNASDGSGSDASESSSVPSETTTSASESETSGASGTSSADASDATSDGSDGDSFAAPTAVPIANAAAFAMGLAAYLL